MKVKKHQPTLSLKPTQFAIGMLEVEYKFHEMKKLSKKELKKLVKENPVPVIISPWKELCIIDHHHFLAACWHADVKEVKVKVVRDFSKDKLTYRQFWQKMRKLNYAYLYDQFGEGPRSPLYLPLDIRGVADDPYRSLAWMVRKEGGYKNSNKSYAEFEWADFFREKKLLESHGREGMHGALKKAIALVKKSDVKRKLPGKIKKEHVKSDLDKKPKAKSKYVPKGTSPRLAA